MEDRLRLQLLRWQELREADSDAHGPVEVLAVLLPQLHSLNAAHFGSSAGITGTLRILEDAVRQGDPDAAWNAFLALAERQGENFGTWAI